MTTFLALLLCLVLPGLAGAVALTSWAGPAGARPGTFVLRALACGMTAWLVSSGLVERTVGISSASSWTTGAVLGAVSVALLVRPASWQVIRAVRGDLGYVTVLTGVALLSWLPVGWLVFRTTWSPLGSTPWYYWGLAKDVARLGHVPATSVEWGTRLPFLDDYHLFETGTATLLTQGGGNGVMALQVVTLLSVVLIACGAALLSNALGAGRIAAVVAVPLAVATGVGATRLTSYRPEGFALGLTLLVAAATIMWLRHGDRSCLAAAGLLCACLSEVHGIAMLTAGVLVVAGALAFVPFRALRSYVVRSVVAAVTLVGSAVVVALLVGSASGTEHAGGLHNVGGLADPTWAFVRAIIGLPASQPPDNRAVFSGAMELAFRGTGTWVAIAVAVATLVLVVAAFRSRMARRTLVFTVLALVGIAAAASFFALGWASYVPRRTGAQRLAQEATLLTGPLVACAVASLPDLGWSATRGGASRRSWGGIVAALVVALLCTGAVRANIGLAHLMGEKRPTQGDMAALRSLHIPHGSVVLANAYTEGYLRQVTGAEGLLEGRAPYTFPRVLDRANQLLEGARTYFHRPRANSDFLAEHDVRYVIVSKPASWSLASGSVFRGRPPLRRLESSPGLTRVLTRPGFLVYRVDQDKLLP